MPNEFVTQKTNQIKLILKHPLRQIMHGYSEPSRLNFRKLLCCYVKRMPSKNILHSNSTKAINIIFLGTVQQVSRTPPFKKSLGLAELSTNWHRSFRCQLFQNDRITIKMGISQSKLAYHNQNGRITIM